MGCFCLPIVQISSMEIFIMKSMFRAGSEALVDIIRPGLGLENLY